MKAVRQQYYSTIPGVTPLSVANCALWLDATDSTSVIQSGGSVSAWIDKSGNSRNVQQTTSGNRPTYTTGTDPYVAFSSASSQYLDICDGNALAVNRTFTFFVVEQRRAGTGTPNYFLGGSTLDRNSNLVTGYYNNTTFLMAFLANDLQVTVPGYNSADRSIVWTFQYTGSGRQIYSNGTLLATDGNTSNLLAWTAPTIGRFLPGPNYYDGRLREIVWYTPFISAGDRTTIEQYLISKYVTLLPSATFPRAFIPPDLSNCALWLDAADQNLVVSSGGSVSAWLDKSGNNRHPAQTSSGNRPSNVTSTPGDAYIQFTSASSQYLDLSDAANLAVNRTFTIFAVEQRRSAGQNYMFAGSDLLTNSNLVIGYYGDGPSLPFLMAFYANDIAFYPPAYSSADPPVVWSFEYTGTNRQILSNGTSAVGPTANTQNLLSWNGAAIGRFGGGSSYYEGRLREIVWFTPSLTTAERTKVEGYLAWKWGFQKNLPLAHAYRYTPVFENAISPLSISNCLLWLDAADPRTVTGTTTVTAWRNKGSLGGSATNRTGSCTYTTDALGRRYISCPTGTDMGITLTLNTQAKTWFIVCRNTVQLTTGQTNFYVPIDQTGTSGQDIIVLWRLTGDNYEIGLGASGVTYNVIATIPNPYNNIGVYTIVNASASTSNVVTLTGNTRTLTTSQNAGSYHTGSATWTLNAAYSPCVGGDLFEIIFYSGALSPTDRRKIESYLAWKWSLSTDLPREHPYKSIRP